MLPRSLARSHARSQDWVMNRGAEALYIPADVQRPWTGRRNEGEYPRKRDAGNTVRAEGVPYFVDVFRG